MIYLIRDKKCALMKLAGVTVYGRKVSIPAMFYSEDDALEILYSVERDHPDLPSMKIDAIEGFTATPVNHFPSKSHKE